MSGVVIKSNRHRRVVGDVRTVAPDDCTAWSSLENHVIAIVASKVQLIDCIDYNQLYQQLQQYLIKTTSRQYYTLLLRLTE